MRICRAYRAAFLALVFLSCTKEAPQQVRHEIHAYAGEDPSVKTVLNPSDEGQVLWSPREHVNVFVGNDSFDYTGNNESAAASAMFSGDGPTELGTYVMLSPYNSQATRSDGTISTTLPAVQTGRAGSFIDGTVVLAGTSSTNSVICKHVCSGIRFKVESADITRVTLSGLNAEKIAGDFTFNFSEGNPVASAGTLEEVSLTPSDGKYFTPNEWYYLAVLPTDFSKGICLTAQSDSKGTGVFTLDGPITFSRAKFKNKASLDGSMNWSKVAACYGPANTICLQPGQSASIDVAPRLILPGWQRSNLPLSGGDAANAIAMLWNTDVVTATLSGSTLTLNAGNASGTELIAIKKGDTILWSFLIWVTNSEPGSEDLGGELFFQWGRKDPLKKDCAVADNQGDNGLKYSIQNPTQFIKKGQNAEDWYTGTIGENDNTLWASKKTVWDPCPEGWKVPAWSHYQGWAAHVSGYDGRGFISDSGDWYYPTMYWTSTAFFAENRAYANSFYNVGYSNNDFHCLAAPVRCVKE